MKKMLVVLLTLSLVIGMFSFAAFADQGNNSSNDSANRNTNSEKDKDSDDDQDKDSKALIVPSVDFNATAMKTLLNKDAALDRSMGNTEDNSDKVWKSYLKDKHSSDNKKNPKLSSKLIFTELIQLRMDANSKWNEINLLNKDIKKAFDKYRASLRVLPKDEANTAMEDMKLTLNEQRARIAASHGIIKTLRLQKEDLWKKFRLAVKAVEFDNAKNILNSATPSIVSLKKLIILEQDKIIHAKKAMKEAILAALSFVPGKVPAVPTFSPKAGAVLKGTMITIKSPGADVYYTTSTAIDLPVASWTKFTDKLTITEPTTVRAIAFRNEISSTTATAIYYAQDYAKAPTDYAVTVTTGLIGMKTLIAGPVAGSTTKAAVTGWVKDGTFSFSFTDNTPTPSAITINGIAYTKGQLYPIGNSLSKHDPDHRVVIVVTTSETDRITAVRTFIIEFRK